MKNYKNLGHNSGVDSFETTDDSISVQFTDGSVYLYTYESAGVQNIEHMKELAISGKGLNGYINKHVRKKYAERIQSASFKSQTRTVVKRSGIV